MQYSYFPEVSSSSYLSEILLHSCHHYLLEYRKAITGSTTFPYLGTLNGYFQCSFEHVLILETLAKLRSNHCLIVLVYFCNQINQINKYIKKKNQINKKLYDCSNRIREPIVYFEKHSANMFYYL